MINPGHMKALVISNESEFMNLEKEWNTLFLKGRINNIFLSFDWHFIWWKNFGKNKALHIIAVYENNELVGIAPLMICRSYFFKEIRFISSNIADYEDILTFGDANHRKEIIATILDKLSENKGWDVFRLNRLKHDSPNMNLYNGSLIQRNDLTMILNTHKEGAPYLELVGNWMEYCQKLRKKLLADTKRQISRLSISNRDFLSEGIKDKEEIRPLVSKLIEFHKKRYTLKNSKSVFNDLQMCSFVRETAMKFFEKGWLDLSYIRIEDKIVAIHLGFNYNSTFYYYIPAYDSSFNHYSIGRLLLFDLLHKSFNDHFSRFDFMVGEEEYKAIWNSNVAPLNFVTIYRRNIRGYLSFLLLHKINIKLKEILRKKW